MHSRRRQPPRQLHTQDTYQMCTAAVQLRLWSSRHLSNTHTPLLRWLHAAPPACTTPRVQSQTTEHCRHTAHQDAVAPNTPRRTTHTVHTPQHTLPPSHCCCCSSPAAAVAARWAQVMYTPAMCCTHGTLHTGQAPPPPPACRLSLQPSHRARCLQGSSSTLRGASMHTTQHVIVS